MRQSELEVGVLSSGRRCLMNENGVPEYSRGEPETEILMTFALYLIGFVIVIAGVAWALTLAGLGSTWIVVVCVILLGLGILTGATRARTKDPPTSV
jgi:hypothetical protein